MPLLRITTNITPDEDSRQAFCQTASQAVADMLGKPERYVMVAFDSSADMRFAASSEPCAYLELKSIGLPEDRTASFSETLCTLVTDRLGIPADRIYIEFANAGRSLWGWNSGTF